MDVDGMGVIDGRIESLAWAYWSIGALTNVLPLLLSRELWQKKGDRVRAVEPKKQEIQKTRGVCKINGQEERRHA